MALSWMQRKITCFSPTFIFPFPVFCVEWGSGDALSWTMNPPWPVSFARDRRDLLCKVLPALQMLAVQPAVFSLLLACGSGSFRCTKPCLGARGAGGRHQQKTQMKLLVQSSQLTGLRFWASLRVVGMGNTKPALGAHFNFNHLVHV